MRDSKFLAVSGSMIKKTLATAGRASFPWLIWPRFDNSELGSAARGPYLRLCLQGILLGSACYEGWTFVEDGKMTV
jgi:hypothetical protein